MRRFLRTLVLGLALGGLPSGASALGLDVLAGGGSLDSGSGLLTFSAFSVVTTGSVSSDLSLYDVTALADGLAITGPISAGSDQAGDLYLEFTVTARQALTGAALSFVAGAQGSGSSASVTETFDSLPTLQLFVFATGGGGQKLEDSTGLDGVLSLRVAKDILVSGVGEGGGAGIERIEQRFTHQAPEPHALVLVALGLVGLAGLRARRA